MASLGAALLFGCCRERGGAAGAGGATGEGLQPGVGKLGEKKRGRGGALGGG